MGPLHDGTTTSRRATSHQNTTFGNPILHTQRISRGSHPTRQQQSLHRSEETNTVSTDRCCSKTRRRSLSPSDPPFTPPTKTSTATTTKNPPFQPTPLEAHSKASITSISATETAQTQTAAQAGQRFIFSLFQLTPGSVLTSQRQRPKPGRQRELLHMSRKKCGA